MSVQYDALIDRIVAVVPDTQPEFVSRLMSIRSSLCFCAPEMRDYWLRMLMDALGSNHEENADEEWVNDVRALWNEEHAK